ncbi:MAG: hypothetical protein ACJ74Y_09195, partial [Bryobacteraceae bacterium]
MSKELVIGSNRHETKVAVLEEDQLVEVYFQRANEYSLAGSIHKGRVTRVLPGMQSAFVDLGLERDTFLYVSDFFEEHDDIDTVDEKPPVSERRDRDRGPGGGGERTGGDRGSREQSASRRNPERQEPEAAPPPEAAAEAAFPEPISPEEEISDVGSEGVSGDPEEARSQERTGEGEGIRGDRRNRRSRRRRHRGRGFPENKYAQPGETSPAPPQRTPVEPTPLHSPEEKKTGPVPEVVVLPGESLAKYRHAAPEARTAASDPAFTRSEPSDPDTEQRNVPAQGESSGERLEQEPPPDAVSEDESEREAIEEEAEEIDLADKVFSHNNEAVVGEEKIPDEEVAPAPQAETEPETRPGHNGRETPGETKAEFALPFETVASPSHAPEARSEAEPLTTFGVNAPLLGREEFFED